MDKFIEIQEQLEIASGTAEAASGDNDLKDTGIFANVSVGDIVHQTADNEFFTVSVKVDDDNVELTALDGGTLPIGAGKTFKVYSATSTKSVLVSSVDVKLVDRPSANDYTVTIGYDSQASANDELTITHLPVASGSEEMRDAVQSHISESLRTAWNQVVYSDSLPKKVIGIVLA